MRVGRVFGSVMVAVMVTSSVVVVQAAAAPVGTDDVVTVGEAAAALADVASVTGPSAVTVASSEGFTAVSAGSVVELPKDPTDGLSLTSADGASIEIGLPGATNADDGVRQASGEVVYADALPDVAVAAQATPDGGMRALVVIDGPQAPTEYRFPVTAPVGARLEPMSGGGVSVELVDGSSLGVFSAPWAYDAAGKPVPTSYRIEGTTLIQTVDHRGAAYPVVADPSWWSVTKCAAAIVVVLATTVFAVAKLTKIKSAVKALGGAKDTAKLLLGATSKEEKAKALAKYGGSAAAELLGISQIVDNC